MTIALKILLCMYPFLTFACVYAQGDLLELRLRPMSVTVSLLDSFSDDFSKAMGTRSAHACAVCMYVCARVYLFLYQLTRCSRFVCVCLKIDFCLRDFGTCT